jgi:hypothetical protein
LNSDKSGRFVPLRIGDNVANLAKRSFVSARYQNIWRALNESFDYAVDLRAIGEPMFIKYNLNVVFAGHEHFYERLKPQKGIHYFTAGGSAKLREGDILSRSALTAKGFDTEQSFMVVEIDGDVLRFQTLTRRGKRIDSGEIRRTPAS